MLSLLPKIESRQLKLWDEPLGNHGHVRTLIGEWTEQIIAGIVGGTRLRTSGQFSYCPDVSVTRGSRSIYLECKAAGLSNQTLIYAGRIEKDRGFVSSGEQLYYAVLRHKTISRTCDTVETLRCRFCRSLRSLQIIPFEAIDTYCQSKQPEKLNSAYGKRPGETSERIYGSGFRLNLNQFNHFTVLEWEQ